MAGTTRTRHVDAVGIVVQDLDKAIDFSTSIIGMEEGRRIDVPDKRLEEVILSFPGSRGAAVLLMHFSDGEDGLPRRNRSEAPCGVASPAFRAGEADGSRRSIVGVLAVVDGHGDGAGVERRSRGVLGTLIARSQRPWDRSADHTLGCMW